MVSVICVALAGLGLAAEPNGVGLKEQFLAPSRRTDDDVVSDSLSNHKG